MGRGLTTIAVFAGVLSIDLVAKAWAEAALAEPVRIADWLYLMLRHNAGVFFGTVPVSTAYWVCVFAAAGWFGWRALRSTRAPVAVCLATALAGVAGNAIGRARGVVVDFIGLGPISGDEWLVVNVADLALVGGALALGCFLLRERMRRARPRSQSPAIFAPARGRSEAGSRRKRHDLREGTGTITPRNLMSRER